MADGTRRRRNPPANAEGDKARRRRAGAPTNEQQRRRRRGSGDAPDNDGSADSQTPVEETPAQETAAPESSPDSSPTRSTTVATDVTLPQLGESVTEGTITAWLVEVGDSVEADQPLFELSSDKIDTEVPAPTSGVLTEIKVQVDETVDVGTVVAVIGGSGEAAEAGQAAGGDQPPAEDDAQASDDAEDDDDDDAEAAGSVEEREAVADEPDAADADQDTEEAGAEEPETADAEDDQDDQGDQEQAAADGAGALTSPLVRRLAAENDIDLNSIKGSGEGGRITRSDVEAAVGGGTRRPEDAKAEKKPAAGKPKGDSKAAAPAKPSAKSQGRAAADGNRTRVEDLSRIRQRIAAKMMESLDSSAQLTTVQEADITRVMQVRERVKDEFKEREGVSLSPFVFLCRAAVIAIRNHPKINAQADWNAGRVTFHDYVNLGIAVDTEKGLLVPNVKGADDLSLAGLARAISDVATRARGKGKLEMSDIEGATFTMTNTGSVGVLIDTPILNYPEVAILGTGAVKKRPVVLDTDTGPSIAIRDMLYLSMTYDHRLIDGADAARFVTEVKEIVETHDWATEVGY